METEWDGVGAGRMTEKPIRLLDQFEKKRWLEENLTDANNYWEQKYPEAVLQLDDGRVLSDDLIDVAQEERLDAIEKQLTLIIKGHPVDLSAADQCFKLFGAKAAQEALKHVDLAPAIDAIVSQLPKHVEAFAHDIVEAAHIKADITSAEMRALMTDVNLSRRKMEDEIAQARLEIGGLKKRLEDVCSKHHKDLYLLGESVDVKIETVGESFAAERKLSRIVHVAYGVVIFALILVQVLRGV